jgi:hypothetical protein
MDATPEKKPLRELTPTQLWRLTEMLNAYADWLETNYPEEPAPQAEQNEDESKTGPSE